jgi:hypothetical protein
MCGSKVSSSVCSIDSLVTPALFCMSPQATSRPGISSIQELTHVTAVLSFALNCGTLEDVDATIVDMFDTGNRGEEHIDGRHPFLGEACLKRQGEYQLNSIGYHIPSSASALSAGFTSSTSESMLIAFTSSSVSYGVGGLVGGSGELGAGRGEEYWSVPQS